MLLFLSIQVRDGWVSRTDYHSTRSEAVDSCVKFYPRVTMTKDEVRHALIQFGTHKEANSSHSCAVVELLVRPK